MTKRILLFLILLAVTLPLYAVSVSAQDQNIDVDSLSNEQLLLLLQAIMQKLNADETESGVAGIAQGPQYQIWENKKLMIERIPDDRFIQKPGSPEKTAEPGGKENDDDSHGWVWDDDVESFPPGLFWHCDNVKCICISPNG